MVRRTREGECVVVHTFVWLTLSPISLCVACLLASRLPCAVLLDCSVPY